MKLSGKSLKQNVRRIIQRSKVIVTGMLALSMLLAGIACGESGSQGIVKATWIEAQVVEDTASIPVDALDNNRLVHFEVPIEGGKIAFMAYDLDGDLIVRANVCPPCRSAGFSLDGDKLVCGTCDTTFEASSGEGISGACANYPKTSVSYEITGGKLIMQGDDMLAAYMDTIEAG